MNDSIFIGPKQQRFVQSPFYALLTLPALEYLLVLKSTRVHLPNKLVTHPSTVLYDIDTEQHEVSHAQNFGPEGDAAC